MRSLSRIMIKYKTEERLIRRIKRCEYLPIIGETERTRLNDLYNDNIILYSHIVSDIWDTVKSEIKESLRLEKPINRFLARHKNDPVKNIESIITPISVHAERPLITKRLFKRVNLLS
jgi:hypothetical protein